MISKAFANELTTSYYAPLILFAESLIIFESSISIEPAPPITFLDFIALLTTIMESFKDLSASLINYSAPPRRTIVDDYVLGQSLNIL